MTKKPIAPGRSRVNDPDATKANILQVATIEFAELGFDGARIDAIAERTKTSKRMIYYYFQSKKGLYSAVLVEYYRRLRSAESLLELEHIEPLEAILRLTHFTFDYHMINADVVRLVMVENIAKGRHIEELPSLEPVNSVLIKSLKKICTRGQKSGVMRKLDPLQLYMTIAALTFFNVSNRYTFSKIFGIDMVSPKSSDLRKKEITEAVLRYVRA
nr:TetR/AcrR family transcriptional regulator [Brevundimonas subvibrioides]